MYCKNCGEEIDDKAAICVKCGVYTEERKDAAFVSREGIYEVYKNIESYEIVHIGIFSSTIDLRTVYGETIRLHYVTSIDIV